MDAGVRATQDAKAELVIYMANYAIGDVQGCYDSLQCLLEKIHFNENTDTLWFAGDLVNRGPHSLKTVQFIKSLGTAAHTVLGNHDLHMLAVAHSCATRKSKDTFFDLLDSAQAPELIHWLQQQPLVLKISLPQQTFVISHAGIPPQWSIEQSLLYSAEVETVLKSSSANDFLKVMYGNEPDGWHDELKSFDRLRVITNYLTRMRFCDAHGKLELETKEASDQAPEGFLPWFVIPNHKIKNTHLIFGHWASLQGQQCARQGS